jgi:hypothetical protein
VRACACVRACARASVSACVRVDSQELACACVRVALSIQHAERMGHIACDPSGSTIVSDIISRFSEENVAEYQMCVLIFSTTFNLNISHSKKNSVIYCH